MLPADDERDVEVVGDDEDDFVFGAQIPIATGESFLAEMHIALIVIHVSYSVWKLYHIVSRLPLNLFCLRQPAVVSEMAVKAIMRDLQNILVVSTLTVWCIDS